MYVNKKLLREELSKTVGFYQSNDINLPVISPSLSRSEFDRYVNEVHGLLTTENIQECQANFSRYNYPKYDSSLGYTEGDIVQDNGIVLEAIQNVPVGTALTDNSYWFELDNFNQYLYQKKLQGIDYTLNFIFDQKKIRNKVKSIYENIRLYDGTANYRDVVSNQNNFVGLRFRLKDDRDLLTIINQIGTHFSEAVSFNLYLYHSSQQTPIATIPINHTKAKSSQWTNQSDLNLRYVSDYHDAGGEYFLGYAQSELGTAQAYKMYSLDWYRGFECGSCSRSKEYWRNYSPWLDVSSFSIAESKFNVGVDLFDPQDVGITNDNNYGLNVNITSKCDLTPFFLQEKQNMAESIKYATGLVIMQDMASNVRGSNGAANQVKQEANTQTVSVDGVNGTVFDMVKSNLRGLSFDLSGLQSECLACDDAKADIIQGTVTFR